jgi:superfamily II DNA helicase RecQ
MQVKLFNTRIDADTIVTDQQAINSFMETVTVKSTATQFVNGAPDFWSILIFYENGEDQKTHKAKQKHTAEKEEQRSTDENIPIAESTAPIEDLKPIKTPKPIEEDDTPLTDEENQILLALRVWRKDKANELQQPEFMVFNNATLHGLAKAKPRKMTELNKVKGIGEAKITRYGDDLMAILNAF